MLKNNRQKIHMMGIGGVGMAGLAILLRRRGFAVSGCDLAETARTRWLVAHGIPVAIGHNPAHLEGVDEVVVTPAVSPSESERIVAGPRIRFRGEVLAELVDVADDSIAVCGSHGKTTTATFIAKLIMALGERVEWCIGGETGDFPVAGGEGGVLVVEADESDGTLAKYHAKTLVVTNVEYDHPDHFPTPADYVACFDVARANSAQVIEGGVDNVETAIKVALSRGHSRAAINVVLPMVTASLPDRRFQKVEAGVYIDYAHHPTEIRYTLKRARAQTKGKLRVLFQPHRYSRTKALKNDFAAALSLADEVILCPTYAAFEQPIEGGDVADLYAAMVGGEPSVIVGGGSLRPPRVYLARSCEEAWTHAMHSRLPDDLTLLLGAGDIIAKRTLLPPRKILIGAGSNTWRSDLDIGEEYVKSDSPAGKSGASLNIPWMAGIPGTIGGWVKMNAGAFGHSISEVLKSVKVDGVWLRAEDCGFGYRTSNITGEIQDIILKPDIEWCSSETYLSRRPHFPPGTYGSFFKNPPGDYAGRLLEAAGAKSLRVGGAYVWSEHANVIVRGEGATASDVLALARLMYNKVFFKFGIKLEPEVKGIVI